MHLKYRRLHLVPVWHFQHPDTLMNANVFFNKYLFGLLQPGMASLARYLIFLAHLGGIIDLKFVPLVFGSVLTQNFTYQPYLAGTLYH